MVILFGFKQDGRSFLDAGFSISIDPQSGFLFIPPRYFNWKLPILILAQVLTTNIKFGANDIIYH